MGRKLLHSVIFKVRSAEQLSIFIYFLTYVYIYEVTGFLFLFIN